MWHRKFVGEVSEWPARVWLTVYRCHGGECQVDCSSEYMKVDILCGQHHRVVRLNYSNPVHTNSIPEQYIHSFVLIFYGTLRSFIGTSSGTGYKHMLHKSSPLPRKYTGPSFVVSTHWLTAPNGCKFAPRNFCFRNSSLHTDGQKV